MDSGSGVPSARMVESGVCSESSLSESSSSSRIASNSVLLPAEADLRCLWAFAGFCGIVSSSNHHFRLWPLPVGMSLVSEMVQFMGSWWGTVMVVLGSQLELQAVWCVDTVDQLRGAQAPSVPLSMHAWQARASPSLAHLTLRNLHCAHAPTGLWVSLKPPGCPVSPYYYCYSVIQCLLWLPGLLCIAPASAVVVGAFGGLAFLLGGMRKMRITYINALVWTSHQPWP